MSSLQTKVYIVSSSEYAQPLGVFSTFDLAKDYIDKLTKHQIYSCIYEYVINDFSYKRLVFDNL